jgi:hypothetical protein
MHDINFASFEEERVEDRIQFIRRCIDRNGRLPRACKNLLDALKNRIGGSNFKQAMRDLRKQVTSGQFRGEVEIYETVVELIAYEKLQNLRKGASILREHMKRNAPDGCNLDKDWGRVVDFMKNRGEVYANILELKNWYNMTKAHTWVICSFNRLYQIYPGQQNLLGRKIQ